MHPARVPAVAGARVGGDACFELRNHITLNLITAAQAKHRRIRRWDLLWLVRSWAARWCALERRKQARAAAYQAAMERADLPEPERAAMEACLHALVEADSQEVRFPLRRSP